MNSYPDAHKRPRMKAWMERPLQGFALSFATPPPPSSSSSMGAALWQLKTYGKPGKATDWWRASQQSVGKSWQLATVRAPCRHGDVFHPRQYPLEKRNHIIRVRKWVTFVLTTGRQVVITNKLQPTIIGLNCVGRGQGADQFPGKTSLCHPSSSELSDVVVVVGGLDAVVQEMHFFFRFQSWALTTHSCGTVSDLSRLGTCSLPLACAIS